MNKKEKMIEKIQSLSENNSSEKTERITITLPSELIVYVKELKKAKGYKSVSSTIAHILNLYFDKLLDDE